MFSVQSGIGNAIWFYCHQLAENPMAGPPTNKNGIDLKCFIEFLDWYQNTCEPARVIKPKGCTADNDNRVALKISI